MNTTYTATSTTSNRPAAITGLAVVGFVALIILGMWLAIYSARFVPNAVSKIGAAAVSLGSVFVPAPTPSLGVVPTATSTTISFGDGATTTPATSTEPVATNPTPTPAPTYTYPTATTPGTPTNSTVQIGGTTGPTLYGLPDLATSITAVGYLSSTSTNTFIASNTVPHGSVAAVRFTIKNTGTNATGLWRFSASIPTQTFYIYQSQSQQNLNPGESIDYTLGFDQANPGVGQTISVTADYDRSVNESNENNNSASASVTVYGS